MQSTRAPWLALAAAAAALAAGPAAAEPPPGKLIEGFEDIQSVHVAGGKIAPAGQVSEGQRAAVLPPNVTVSLVLEPDQLARMPWLKIDTLAVQPVMHSLRIALEGRRISLSQVGHVNPGKDTLAFPLPAPPSRRDDDSPAPPVTLTLTNLGPGELILDNVRVEPPAAAPEGAVLVDFGPSGHRAWPGFEAASQRNDYLEWEEFCTGHDRGFPDPLAGDCVGRYVMNRSTAHVTLMLPAGLTKASAWLWVTHYGPHYTPAMEYAVKVGGKTALHRRLAGKQMLGPAGLLIGREGPWTPQWLDEDYAERLVDIVEVPISSGVAVLELGNCQVAALAAAPAGRRAAMIELLKQVRREQSRYRRQFTLGAAHDLACPREALAGIEEGLAVFQPPADEAFAPLWRPTLADRAETFKTVVDAGGLAVIPLAVVPLQKTLSLTAAPLHLRSGVARVLSAAANKSVDVWFVETVPRLLDGRLCRQPWVLQGRLGPVEARELCRLAVVVRPPQDTPPGTYSGKLLLSFTGGRREVAIEVEVVDAGPAPDLQATFGSFSGGAAEDLYGGLTVSLTEPKLRALNAAVRGHLMTHGLNALAIEAPSLSSEMRLYEQTMAVDLETYPVKWASGRTVLSLGGPLWRLDYNEVKRDSPEFRRVIAQVVGAANTVAAKARLRGHCFYQLWAHSEEDLANQAALGRVVAAAGGAPATGTSPDLLARLDPASREHLLGSIRVLILDRGHRQLVDLVDGFKKLEGRRDVLLHLHAPARYPVGFYAAALNLDGCLLNRLFGYVGPYAGFAVDGVGLLAATEEGQFTETLGLLAVQQGRADYELMHKAAALMARAGAGGAEADELAKVYGEIVTRVRSNPHFSYDAERLCGGPVRPAELESWRSRLVTAMGEVVRKLETAPAK